MVKSDGNILHNITYYYAMSHRNSGFLDTRENITQLQSYIHARNSSWYLLLLAWWCWLQSSLSIHRSHKKNHMHSRIKPICVKRIKYSTGSQVANITAMQQKRWNSLVASLELETIVAATEKNLPWRSSKSLLLIHKLQFPSDTQRPQGTAQKTVASKVG